jgi:uncharacterized protein
MDFSHNKKISLILFLIFLLIGISSSQNEIPTIHQRVTDQTSMLSSDEVRSLEQKLYEFEQQTSNQIVVLMITSLEGQSLEDISYRIAEKNKIGKKGKDNGVFLFIVKNDQKMRIDAGYGLEGVLTDALSSQIIRNVIGPRFRNGDFFGGISDGVEAIMLATKGEFKGESKSDHIKKFSPFGIILMIIIFGVFRTIFMGGRRRSVGASGVRSNFPWWWGGFGGGGGGGFSGGSFGGGGGFGGFSGGGGSFGGGGASGSW